MDIIYNCIYYLLTCCRYSKKEKKILTDEEIQNKAKIMLNDWKVTIYANNKFLYRIPEAREKEQLNIFIKELTQKI